MPIVFAFAGDSTMTSDVVPAAAAGYSSSTTARLPRVPAVLVAVLVAVLAALRFATVFVAVPALFFAAVRLVVVFLAAMSLVYGLGIRRSARIVEPGSFHHRAQVVEGDASVELDHRSLDHLLELCGVERSGIVEREQMAPRLRGEAATLVWA